MDGLSPYVKGYFLPENGNIVEMYYNPAEIEEEFNVNYAKLNPLGFSHPVCHYIGGGGNNVNFTILVKKNIAFGYTEIDVEDYIKRIKDFCLPVRQGGKLVACPPLITFIFGSLTFDLKLESLKIKREFWDRYLKLKIAHLSFSCFIVVKENMNRQNYTGGYFV